MSYQTTNRAFEDSLQTAHRHLKERGILLFDFWYGPAVLHEKPEVRVKRIENENIEIIRIAEPELNISTNTVVINYQIIMKQKSDSFTLERREKHEVRYFFIPELMCFAEKNGFRVVKIFKWMSNAESLSMSDWYGVAVFEKT